MVQTTNRFFDEVARLMNDAAGVAQGVRREAETLFRTQAERILRELAVVQREEFEAVKDMARLAREENEDAQSPGHGLGSAARRGECPRRRQCGRDLGTSRLRRPAGTSRRLFRLKPAYGRMTLSSHRHPALAFCLSMIFSENRPPLFRIML